MSSTDGKVRLINYKEVKQLVGYSRMHLYRLERSGQFPRRVQVGPNRIMWWEAEVIDWMKSRPLAPLAAGEQPCCASVTLAAKKACW